ncbi:MFS transporter [Streptomyces sp. NPDC047002]|uniref:MFS transporter n=1 Tax=Streptomyces sp. NPDC047002 TaxID=3155475 RepID=UPI003454E11F
MNGETDPAEETDDDRRAAGTRARATTPGSHRGLEGPATPDRPGRTDPPRLPGGPRRAGRAQAGGGRAQAGGGRPADTAAAAPAAVPAPKGRGWLVAALMVSTALAALDSTIVSTAVPQIVGDLGGFPLFSWLFSGYLLAVTVTLPVYGKLSDTFGRKPVLLAGIALFVVGSLLCATAWNMPSLIAFRIVQGLGGGALTGTVQTVAADVYALKDRPKIQAKLSTVWATSSVAGPTVGGLFAGYVDWRWIFLVNLPIGVVALVLIARHLHEPSATRTAHPGRALAGIDWSGAVLIFATGSALLTALVQGGVAWPWLSGPSLGFFGAAAALGAATIAVERRAAEPIIPGWVWRRRSIVAVNLALGALGLLMVAPTVFVPTYAQSVLGLGPIPAGFVLSAMSLAWPIAGALSSRVYTRVGFKGSGVIGMSMALAALLMFPFLPFPGAPWQPVLVLLLLGAGLGLFQLPQIISVQSSVSWAERGTATASILFCRQIGQSVGAALFGAVANSVLASRLAHAPTPGLHDLNSVSQALDNPGSLTAAGADYLRRAVDAATGHVFLFAACAAALSLLVLLLVAPRRTVVLLEDDAG